MDPDSSPNAIPVAQMKEKYCKCTRIESTHHSNNLQEENSGERTTTSKQARTEMRMGCLRGGWEEVKSVSEDRKNRKCKQTKNLIPRSIRDIEKSNRGRKPLVRIFKVQLILINNRLYYNCQEWEGNSKYTSNIQ